MCFLCREGKVVFVRPGCFICPPLFFLSLINFPPRLSSQWKSFQSWRVLEMPRPSSTTTQAALASTSTSTFSSESTQRYALGEISMFWSVAPGLTDRCVWFRLSLRWTAELLWGLLCPNTSWRSPGSSFRWVDWTRCAEHGRHLSWLLFFAVLVKHIK